MSDNDTIILPTKFDEDEFFNDTAEVIIALEQALEEKLGSLYLKLVLEIC